MSRRIALALHPDRPVAAKVAGELEAALSDRGVETLRLEPGTDLAGVDLALSLGGDGTFLRVAHRVRDLGIPVLGFNLGRLGFLAEVEMEDVDRACDAIADGAWSVEERATLEVETCGADGEVRWSGWALNEVSVEKTARQRVLVMEVEVGGTHVTAVPADAIVVSTPTGSTAYAFSAGGPILSPRVDGTLVTPVAPHSVFGRTIVAASDELVTIRVVEEQAPAVVSCDGREPVEVPAGGSVRAIGGGAPVGIARIAAVDFYGVVRHKFGLR